VETAAVVAHFHGDVAAAMAGIEVHGAFGGLAGGDARFRRFDAVVDGIAHQVNQRIADLLEHGLVELGLLTRELQLDLLAEALRQVAHHAREAAENEGDGQHANPHDAFLQLAHVALELPEAGAQLLRIRPVEVRAELTQHRLRDHELAHGVHELVDLLHAHADGARVAERADRRFRLRRRGGGRGGGRRRVRAVLRRRRRCRRYRSRRGLHGCWRVLRARGQRLLSRQPLDAQVAVALRPLEDLADGVLGHFARKLERPGEVAVLRIDFRERGCWAAGAAPPAADSAATIQAAPAGVAAAGSASLLRAIATSRSNCRSETRCESIGCFACTARSMARMTSTDFSSRSDSATVTGIVPLRSSSSSVSRLWVKEAISEKPKVALPPLIEWATRKIVLMSSGSGEPTSSLRSAASMASSASKLSSKNAS